MEKIEQKIGFIGGGNMGAALIGGLINSKAAERAQLAVSDKNERVINKLIEQFDIFATADNKKLTENADVIVLAVKPQYVDEVTAEIGPLTKPVISIVAGVTSTQLAARLGPDCPLVRVMPNTPSLVGAGAAAIYFTDAVRDPIRRLAKLIFKSVGKSYTVDREEMIDAVTGLSGSGPAYIFLVIDALADGGVRMGLPRPLAQALATQTVLGAAALASESGKHPAELKDMVTSPGGTTAEGLAVLEAGALRSLLAEAVVAAAEKSKKLSGD